MKRFVARCQPFVGAVLLAAACSSVAEAQTLGIRAGASADPDQFYFGGHADAARLADRLWFRPNVEIGVGSDLTLVALNFEVVYRFPLSRSPWTAYAGAGPAANIYRFDDNTETQGGLNFLGGFEHTGGFFSEVKLGAIDSPDFKFAIGYTFR
ncbi:MAG: hypothetical protein LC804_12975 [Acidobacteria bacterium]|nr:hypothetical protein [Acidobacteriota bacterium]